MLVRAPGGTIGDAITDFTVINEQQPKVCAQAATTAYAAAEDAERRKKAKHSEAARALQLGFWPLAMENGGACGPSLQSYFHELRRLVEAAGGEGSKGRPMPGSTWANRTFMQYWVQLLSVTFQKETANGLLKLRRRLARHFGDGFAPHGSGQHQAPLVVHRENEEVMLSTPLVRLRPPPRLPPCTTTRARHCRRRSAGGESTTRAPAPRSPLTQRLPRSQGSLPAHARTRRPHPRHTQSPCARTHRPRLQHSHHAHHHAHHHHRRHHRHDHSSPPPPPPSPPSRRNPHSRQLRTRTCPCPRPSASRLTLPPGRCARRTWRGWPMLQLICSPGWVQPAMRRRHAPSSGCPTRLARRARDGTPRAPARGATTAKRDGGGHGAGSEGGERDGRMVEEGGRAGERNHATCRP